MSWLKNPLAPDLPGGYRALEPLGHGACGEVWRAEAPGGVDVAVKLIPRNLTNSEEVERELVVLQHIKRLRHPYLLSVQAYFALESCLVIVLELADRSLRERFQDCREAGLDGIPAAELLGYLREAAEALDYLHVNNVQHRDVKPDNLLLLGQHIKVADFGVARVLERHSLQTATTVGTPAYMPPEIWEGKISTHSDQYSLAATYAELRLGRQPFPSHSLTQLMHCHLQEKPELDALGEAEREVLAQALAKTPAERFASCSALVHALAEALGRQTPAGTPATAGPRPADSERVADLSPSPTPVGSLRLYLEPVALAEAEGTVDSAPGRLTEKEYPGPLTEWDTPEPPAPRTDKAICSPISHARARRGAARRWLRALPSVCVLAGGVGLLAWSLLPLLQKLPEVSAAHSADRMAPPPAPVPSLQKGSTPKPPTDAVRAEQPVPPTVAAPAAPGASVRILPLQDVAVQPGQVRSFGVRVERRERLSPVALRLDNLPPGVTASPARIPGGRDVGGMAVTVRQGTEPTTQRVRLVALTSGERAESEFLLTIGPPKPAAQRLHEDEAAIDRAPQDPLARQNLGHTCRELGEHDKAIANYTEAIRLDPTCAAAHNNRGNVYQDRKEYDKAIAEYDAALRLDPTFTVALNNRGSAFYAKGDHDRAIADCSAALRLDPDQHQAHHVRGLAHFAKGEYDLAIADYSAAIDFEPHAVGAYLSRGHTHAVKKEYDRAIADYSAALQAAPGCALAHSSRGNVYRMQGDYDRAIADCSEAIWLAPNHHHAHTARGLAHLGKKAYDEAIADFTEALRLNLGDSLCYNSRAAAYAGKKDYPRAIRDLTEALRLKPDCALAWTNRGSNYLHQGQYDRAIADFTEALRLNPQDPLSHNDRGAAHAARKEYDRAIRDQSEAIRLKPDFALAYLNRGLNYLSKGEYDRAIEDANQVLRLEPEHYAAYNVRGAAYARKKDYDRAIRDYSLAIRFKRDFALAYANRCRAYRAKGDRERARVDRAAAVGLDPSLAGGLPPLEGSRPPAVKKRTI